MAESVFNLVLYLSVLVIYIGRHHRLDLYVIILFLFTMTALIGMVDFLVGGIFNKEYCLSIFRLSYLFIVIIICISPFKQVNLSTKSIYIVENRPIRMLIFLFIGAGIISAFLTLPKTFAIQAMDDWQSLRSDVYAGDSSMTLYDSQFERFIKNIYSYLKPFGCVIAFYQLTKKKINKLLTAVLFFVWVVNTYTSATLIASRGLISYLAFEMLILYVLFRDYIPRKRKRTIFISAVLIGLFFYGYTIAVTDARFGDESKESLMMYFGHSMFAFDDGIMRTMHSYANGRYQFGWLYRLLGESSFFNWQELGCTHGTAFMTFVGNIYVDFGPFLTVIVAIILALLVFHFTNKRSYYLSDIIIIVFAAQWYSEGIFVFAGDQSLRWLMAFIVYYIVRFIENRNYGQENCLRVSAD